MDDNDDGSTDAILLPEGEGPALQGNVSTGDAASPEEGPAGVRRKLYSLCGVGYGVAADIAVESERYRWMGPSRYAFLKVRRVLRTRRAPQHTHHFVAYCHLLAA